MSAATEVAQHECTAWCETPEHVDVVYETSNIDIVDIEIPYVGKTMSMWGRTVLILALDRAPEAKPAEEDPTASPWLVRWTAV